MRSRPGFELLKERGLPATTGGSGPDAPQMTAARAMVLVGPAWALPQKPTGMPSERMRPRPLRVGKESQCVAPCVCFVLRSPGIGEARIHR